MWLPVANRARSLSSICERKRVRVVTLVPTAVVRLASEPDTALRAAARPGPFEQRRARELARARRRAHEQPTRIAFGSSTRTTTSSASSAHAVNAEHLARVVQPARPAVVRRRDRASVVSTWRRARWAASSGCFARVRQAESSSSSVVANEADSAPTSRQSAHSQHGGRRHGGRPWSAAHAIDGQSRQAGHAVRRQVPHHRLLAVELRELRASARSSSSPSIRRTR